MENTNLPQATQPPMLAAPKTWYQHKGIIFIIVLAVIAAVAVWVYFILNQPLDLGPVVVDHGAASINKNGVAVVTAPATASSSSPLNLVPASMSSTSPLQIPSNWLDFRSGYFGFDLKYPPGWTAVAGSTSDKKPMFVFYLPTGGSYTGNVTIIPQEKYFTLGNYFNNPVPVPNVSNVTISGQNFTKYDYGSGFTGYELIGNLPRWGQDNSISVHNDIPNQTGIQILSSLNFFTPDLDSSTTAWQTYQIYQPYEGMAFSIKYPLDWSHAAGYEADGINSFYISDQIGELVYLDSPVDEIDAPKTPPTNAGMETETLTVGGENATMYVYQGWTGFAEVYFSNPALQDYRFVMEFDYSDKDFFVPLFKQMLSTVQFEHLDLNNDDWQSTNNASVDYQVSYPPTWMVESQSATSTLITDDSRGLTDPNGQTAPFSTDSFVIITQNPNCQPSSGFQPSDFGQQTLVKVVCASGLQFTLGAWQGNYDLANITQALQEIPGTLNLVTPDEYDQGEGE